MSILTRLRQHWTAFRDDAPGERFRHQYERMRRERAGLVVSAVVLGTLLVAFGVVLLFVPGPGLLLVVFGLALIASVSRPLATLLDRGEPIARRGARRVRTAWQSASVAAKLAASVALLTLGVAAALGLYRVWLA